MASVEFVLYVAGDTPRSRQAVANLHRLGAQELRGDYRLQVVDVVADPEAAERERILTTPTVVKTAPQPSRRVTGDLSDLVRVFDALALQSDAPEIA